MEDRENNPYKLRVIDIYSFSALEKILGMPPNSIRSISVNNEQETIRLLNERDEAYTLYPGMVVPERIKG
jgi:hypothetical protein